MLIKCSLGGRGCTVEIPVKFGPSFARAWAELEFVTRLLQDQGSSSQTLSIPYTNILHIFTFIYACFAAHKGIHKGGALRAPPLWIPLWMGVWGLGRQLRQQSMRKYM